MADLSNAQFAALFAAKIKQLIDGDLTVSEFEAAITPDFDNWYTLTTTAAQRLVDQTAESERILATLEGLIIANGAPQASDGDDGSYFFDAANGGFYGPKTAGDWGSTNFSLIGPPGKKVELQKSATHIQWRYEGAASWTNLIALADLKGEDGTEIELQATATHIQWRLVGGTWANLIALSALKGADGQEVSLQTTATHIQWRLGTGAWQDLIALSALKGDEGASAYEVAVSNGFVGTEVDWLESLTGPQGKSAYQVAVDGGFTGTVSEWLQSLIGPQGKLADDFKGAWDGATAYAADDIVTYQGETWLALQGSTGTTPAEGATWTKLAAKGADGAGSGTVTSVAISGSDGIEIDSGSPITSSGTIALGVNKAALLAHINVEDGADVTDAANVAAAGAVMDGDFSANGFMKRTGAGAYSSVSEIPLADLEQDGATDGQVLTWNNTAGVYEPQNATGGGGVTVAAIQSSAFTPEAGTAYPVDLRSGSFSLSGLLDSPSQGDRFEIYDAYRAAGESNALTVPANVAINGDAVDFILTRPGFSGVVEYVDATQGYALTLMHDSTPDTYRRLTVAKPALTSPTASATDLPEQPVVSTSAYAMDYQSDTHASTDWQVATDAGFTAIVVESLADASNLESWTVPAGNLSEGTTYHFRARHRGASGAVSEWSDTVTAATAATFNDPATSAYIAALSTPPSQARTQSLDAFFRGLKSGAVTGSDLLSKMAVLLVPYGHDDADALVHLNDPSVSAINNGCTFDPAKGIVSSGNPNWIDTNKSLTGLVSPGDAAFGVWCDPKPDNYQRVFRSDGANDVGWTKEPDGDGYLYVFGQQLANQLAGNASGLHGWTLGDGSSTALKLFFGGARVSTSASSGGLGSTVGKVQLFRDPAGSDYYTGSIRVFFAATLMTEAEWADFYTALNNYFLNIALEQVTDADAEAYIRAMDVPPTSAEGKEINDLIVGLKADGTWTGFDRLWLPLWDRQGGWRLNAISPASAGHMLTPYNSPVLTPGEGVQGDGSTAYVSTQFEATNDGVNFTQNDACFGFYVRTAGTGNRAAMYGGDGTGRVGFQIISGAGYPQIGGSSGPVTLSGTTGLFTINRPDSATLELWRNGSLEDSSSSTSSALGNIPIALLTKNEGGTRSLYSNDELSAAFVGRSFTPTEQAAIHTRLNTFLTNIGAI